MANVKNNLATQDTRRRLLEAAGEVFADRGFQSATIKQITDFAGTNLASVNYHFKDKAELYTAVLRQMAENAAELIPPEQELTGSPARRLEQFIRYFCSMLSGVGNVAWPRVLIAREIAEPTAALAPLHELFMKPLGERLSKIIADLLGVPTTDPAVAMAAVSVLGQCFYFAKPGSQIEHFHPQLRRKLGIDLMVENITTFSLAGLRARRRQILKSARRTR